jgi:hypothetical protein
VGLAALILVSDKVTEAQPLPFGLTATEIQARQAMAMGANPVLIHTEDMDPSLAAALARLKSGGHPVKLVRSNAEAANHIHPQENVLLYAGNVKFDGADPHHLQGSYIAVRPLEPGRPDQELIDAQYAWSGLALLPGSLIRDVNGLVGDWALGSTLLRLAVQQGVEKRLYDGEPLVALSANANDMQAKLKQSAMALASKLPSWALPLVALLPLALCVLAFGFSLADLHVAGLSFFLLAMAANWFRQKVGAVVHAVAIPALSSKRFHTICAGLLLLIFSFSLASIAGQWELIILTLWWLWLQVFALKPEPQLHANAVTAVVIILIGALIGQAYWAFPIIMLHALASYHFNERSLGRH